jgi:hypothetical protein
MSRPVSGRDAVRSQVIDVLEAQIKRRPARRKVSTEAAKQSRKISEQLTVGLDLGDRSRCYGVLDEAGAIVLEQKLGTTPKAMEEGLGGMPRSRIAQPLFDLWMNLSQMTTDRVHVAICLRDGDARFQPPRTTSQWTFVIHLFWREHEG